MPVFVIDCDAAVSVEQKNELVSGLPCDGAAVFHQVAEADPARIATVTLVLAFSSRAFFDAFLSEPGDEAVSWFKVKSNMMRASGIRPMRVEYRIHVGDILFVDDAPEWVAERHEKVLGTVDDVYRRIQAEELWNAKCVRLRFDTNRNDYTEARLFRRVYANLDAVSNDEAYVLRVFQL